LSWPVSSKNLRLILIAALVSRRAWHDVLARDILRKASIVWKQSIPICKEIDLKQYKKMKMILTAANPDHCVLSTERGRVLSDLSQGSGLIV